MSTKTRKTESVIGRVVDEFTDRLHRGESPRIDDYTARHSDIADELQEVLAAVEVMSLISDESQAPSQTPSLDPEDENHLRGRLGDFRILREIGRGGMGVVYEAEEISLGRRVALKLLPFAAVMDPRQLARFRTEAQAAAILQHPHIVAVYGVGCERGVHYYAMQYIEGTTLATVIEQLRQDAGDGAHRDGDAEACEPDVNSASAPTAEIAKLSTMHSTQDPDYYRSVARLGIQAAEALDHAHASGVLHRDIKPCNLMLDARGNLWITDFGLARIDAQAGLTLTGDLLGTPRYMSPEQVLGKRAVIDHRSDIYSLGATLYELLTLTPAAPGSDREEVLNHIATDEPRAPGEINPAIPTDLSTIVQTALAKSPDERYDTAAALADDLKRFLNHQPIHAQPPTLRQRLMKWSFRHKSFVAALTASLLFSTIALAVATFFISRSRTEAVNASRGLQRALDEKQTALDAKDAALKEREAALEREWETSHRVYPIDIESAFELLNHGKLELARNLLGLHIPETGSHDLRGFEWDYLWGLCHPRGQLLRGHTESVFSVSFSPDSRLLATASGDRTVRLWDRETGRLVHQLTGHEQCVNCVEFSPSGDEIVTASDDMTIAFWDPNTGARLETLRGHLDEVQCVQFAPDGRTLASASIDGEVRTWDRASGRVIRSVKGHDDRIRALAISPDGNRLATSSGALDPNARLWTMPHLEPLETLHHEGSVEFLVFRQQTDKLIGGCRGGEIRTWDTRTGKLMSKKSTGLRMLAAELSPDGARLATNGAQRLNLWDVEDFDCQAVYSLGHFHAGWCVGFSLDGRFLAAGDHHDVVLIRTDQPPNYQQLATLDTGVECLAVAPDGWSVVVGCPDGTLRWLDLSTGEEFSRRTGHAGGVSSLEFSPNGELLATGGADRTVVIWDANTHDPLQALTELAGNVTDVAFSCGGHRFAACGGSEVVTWDVNEWKETDKWDARGVEFLAFSQEMGLLYGGDNLAYRPPNQTPIPIRSVHPHKVTAIDVTPNGELVALGLTNLNPGVVDFRKPRKEGGIAMTTLSPHRSNRMLAVAVSHDGKTLAAIDTRGHTAFWNLATGTKMLTIDTAGLTELPDEFENACLAFTADDSALLFGLTPDRNVNDTDRMGRIFAMYAPRFDKPTGGAIGQ